MTPRICMYLLAVLLCFGVTNADAAKPESITPEEMALLPRWCNDTISFPGHTADTRNFDAYLERYGPGWKSVHHYCWAMIHQMRMMRSYSDKPRREHFARRLIEDLDYVLNNSNPDFAFRQEIYQRRAATLRITGRQDESLATLRKWAEEWPKAKNAHIALIEALVAMGRKPEAREALQIALAKLDDREEFARLSRQLGID